GKKEMKIFVKVKPQAKEGRVEKKGGDNYLVWVKAKAIEGKANQAVIKILSEYFDITKNRVILIKGKKARDKIFTVNI
ncbi:MAG: DUF167 domain-containing protein, partial [Candidatus Omnitrophota bacterium]|nr:DUF167 domain-containing protein [Candidatus Omnitrophota bacterium]